MKGQNPGTFSGTTPTWEQSPYGPAVKLDGSTNWINVPFTTGSVFNCGCPLTISAWIFWRASTATYNAIVDNNGAASTGWTLFLKSNQIPAIYANGTGVDPVGSNTVPFNQWVHIVATIGGGVDTVYMNGILLGTGNVATPSGLVSTDLRIGSTRDFGGRWFNGSMRDIGLWNRVLSTAEIQQLFLLGNGAVFTPRKDNLTAAGTLITESLSDSFTLSDAAIIQVSTPNPIVSDSFSLSDSVTTRIDVPQIAFSETLTFSDTPGLLRNDFMSLTETLSLSDLSQFTAGIVLPSDIQDVLTLSDSVGNLLIGVINRVATDSMSFLDSDQVNFVIPRAVLQDFILFTDAIRISSNLQLSESDQLVLNDLNGLLLAPIANLSPADQITFTDLVTTQLNSIFTSLNITSVDSIQLMDSVQLTLLRSLVVLADSFTLSDSICVVLQSTITSYIRRYLNDVV